MSIFLIVTGLIFLLNPCVMMIDVLPDFIGAILIMIGIRKVAFISESCEKLNDRLWVVMLLSLLKLSLSFFMRNARSDVQLLVFFLFTLAELFLLISTFSALSTSFDNMSVRYCDPEKSATRGYDFSRLKRPLIIFTVLRLVLSVVPTVAKISENPTHVQNVSRTDDYMFYANVLFIGLAAVCSVICAIIVIRYFKKFSKDRATIEGAIQAGEKLKAEEPNVWRAKMWHVIRIPLVTAGAFSIYAYVDGIDYFPKVVAAVFFLAVTFLASESKFHRIMSVAVNVTLGAASVLCELALVRYFSGYTEASAAYIDAARGEFTKVTILLLIQAALLFASHLLLCEIIKKRKFSEISELSENGILLRRKLSGRLWLIRVLSFFQALAAAAYPVVKLDFKYIFTILFTLSLALVFAIYSLNLEKAE